MIAEPMESSIFTTITVYASFLQRVAAIVIDMLLLAVPDYVVRQFIGGSSFYNDLFINHQLNIVAALYELPTTAVDWLYMAVMESGTRQATVGKMLMGIMVTDVHGGRISFGRATGRYFAKYCSTITLLAGYFMMLWDARHQMLHDKIAATLVVKRQPML